jgi:hypothetical protein
VNTGRANSGVLAVVLGVALTAASGGIAAVDASSQPTASFTAQASSSSHRSASALLKPDPTLHPSAIDPAATKARLCAPGFTTKSVRPPTSYTGPLKHLELGGGGRIVAPSGTNYTVVGEQLPGQVGDYELDHLISLELGGNPERPANLWMEPYERKGSRLAPLGLGAESKDVVENRLHREVCAGTISLAAAQQAIANNWMTAP